jgi:hypothetical protein
VTGDPTSDTRSYEKVDDHTLTFTAKKGGKVTLTRSHRLFRLTARPAESTPAERIRRAEKISTSAVYDKQ